MAQPRERGSYFYKQSLISFPVGPYCGEVLCDVLHVHACHVSLGRPRLFNNHVICDGQANTYACKYKGHSLTWPPYHYLNLSNLK